MSPFSRISIAILVFSFILIPAASLRAEILNDDEYGSMELVDLSVIESAAGMFTPVGLSFNVTRGGPIYPG